MSLKGNVSYDERPADLIDCIAYTDNTNPLYIYQGNPSLTSTRTLNANLRYNFMLTRGSLHPPARSMPTSAITSCSPVAVRPSASP